jgi:Ca-activated chloride channel family protein
VPLSLVVALDVSASMTGDRFRLASEGVKILSSQMHPADQIALIGFNGEPFLIAPWTSEPTDVLTLLERVRPHGRTALYDAVEMALTIVRDASNRKSAIVVISDGNDFHVAGPATRYRTQALQSPSTGPDPSERRRDVLGIGPDAVYLP